MMVNTSFLDTLFILFSTIIVISSVAVILAKNPIHSVLFLILTFISAISLMFLLGSEFFAFIFLIIYVGAIAVLFLFIVMMLNIQHKKSKSNERFVFYISAFFSSFFLFEVINILLSFFFENPYFSSFLYNYYSNWYTKIDNLTEIDVLGQVIYSHYVIQFLMVGNILLLAVVSVIVLTLTYNKKNKKKQFIFKQISREYKHSVITNRI